MDLITQIIIENADAIANILFVVCGSLIAKIYVMFSTSKNKWWYKLIEACALVIGKVKEKAEDAK